MPVLEPPNKAEFDKILADAKGKGTLVVIDFFATWCGPCKLMSPKFHKLADEFTTVVFVKIDVDEHEDIASEFDIRVMPTFICVKDGRPVIELPLGIRTDGAAVDYTRWGKHLPVCCICPYVELVTKPWTYDNFQWYDYWNECDHGNPGVISSAVCKKPANF